MPSKSNILIPVSLRREFTLSGWDTVSLSIIILSFILQLLRLPFFPLFIDTYYHLSVMLGFDQAGGYVTHAFWEASPFGRAHLYPPLLHIVMLLLYKVGFSKIFIAKFFDFILYPAALLAIWLIFRKVISGIFAFFAVLIAASSYTFYLGFVNTHAASCALLICLGVFYCIWQRKTAASIMLFGLSFYTHPGISGFFIPIFILYGLFDRGYLTACLKAVLGAIVIAAPLLACFYINRSNFHAVNLNENSFLEFNLAIYLGAILGLCFFLKNKKIYYLFLFFVLGMLPMVFNYRFRYFCFQGLLGYILLCSSFIYELFLRIRRGRGIFLAGILILFFVFSPVINLNSGNIGMDAFGSNLFKQIGVFMDLRKENRGSDLGDVRNSRIYDRRSFEGIVRIIRDNSESDDIIYSDLNYAGGILGVFSERATSTTMLKEIRPKADFDPVSHAKVIILFRENDGSINAKSEMLIKKYSLIYIAATELASVYINPEAKSKRIIEKPLISTPFLIAIFLIYLSILPLFLRNNRQS
ncbi:MAG: hypothetical protein Q8L26_00960 [Candidatus Omnitrophota bacterium]|nr:hypothetical protein [Candidatus Omnitrophota bacterium]